MPSIVDVAAQLAAARKPVFLPDTCILLDIIRSIKRCHARYAAIATQLHKGIAAPKPRFSIAVSDIVKREWQRHAAGIATEAEENLEEIEEYASHFHEACKVFRIKPSFSRATYSRYNLIDRLRTLSADLLNAGPEIDPDNQCFAKAFQRTHQRIPPAQKGKDYMDCYIVEQYLALCRELQARGFRKKVVFCTSNTNDYYEGGHLHGQLQTDFASAALIFTTNLGWALNELQA